MKKNIFKKTKRFLATFLVISLLLSGCGKTSKDEKETSTNEEGKSTEATSDYLLTEESIAENEAFKAYIDNSYGEMVTTDTLTLHYSLAQPEDFYIDIDIPEPTLGDSDMSYDALMEDLEETKSDYKELQAFDYDLLSEDYRDIYDLLAYTYDNDIESYDYIYYYEPFAQTSGLHNNLPITMAEYIFYDEGDVTDYIEILNQIPDYFDGVLSFEEEKSKQGFFMADFAANKVISDCENFIKNPEENLLIDTFNERVDALEGISDEAKETYKEQNKDAVLNSVIPAYKNVISVFKLLRSTGKNDGGICNFENGKDYYALLIKEDTCTSKTPDEIIEFLESKTSEVMANMYTSAFSDEDAITYFYENYETLLNQDGVAPEEVLEEVANSMKPHFPEIGDLNYTISYVHESMEDSLSPAFYMTPPLDDFSNNSININGGAELSSLWSTIAHEGYAGHMYQFVYYLENDPEPIRYALSFSGYSEGWATYVENMSYEFYDYADFDETMAELCQINNQLSLLISARIDIGVNYEGWTLEECETYLLENGFDKSFAKDIFEYVIAEPANYQMYVVSYFEFLELRAFAEESLGDSFDEVEFHKVILDAGPCTFDVLEKKVKNYIEKRVDL